MWYTASLLFKGLHGRASPMTPLWEQVIVLVEASSDTDARALAERMGTAREHSYLVSSPEPHVLRWVFERVELVFAIDEPTLASGVEVFGRFLRQSEVESLLTPFEEDRGDVS
jgi:hypothetical protein